MWNKNIFILRKLNRQDNKNIKLKQIKTASLLAAH